MALLFYEVFMIELEQKELTQEQLVEVKSRLQSDFEMLTNRLQGFRVGLADQQVRSSSPDDEGSNSEEFANTIAQQNAARIQLQKTKNALARVDRDDFSYCDECDDIITARILNNPIATHCVTCATIIERQERNYAR